MGIFTNDEKYHAVPAKWRPGHEKAATLNNVLGVVAKVGAVCGAIMWGAKMVNNIDDAIYQAKKNRR